MKFDGLLWSKNKFVQKIHSFSWNIIYRVFKFQLIVWKFTKLLMSLYHFSRYNSSVFSLSQTLHNFYKSSPARCKFSDFLLLGLKFTKFLMSFFKQKVSFSSKVGSFFSVMRDNSSVLFSTSKCKFSDLSLLALKFTKFHFWNQESVFLQTLYHSSVLWDITLLYLLI